MQRNVHLGDPVTASEGELTNPADDALVADSGEVDADGQYELFAVTSASANSQVKMQRRNGANDATVGAEVGWYVPANQSVPIAWTYALRKGERVRIIMDDAQAAGTVWGTLCLKRIG